MALEGFSFSMIHDSERVYWPFMPLLGIGNCSGLWRACLENTHLSICRSLLSSHQRPSQRSKDSRHEGLPRKDLADWQVHWAHAQALHTLLRRCFCSACYLWLRKNNKNISSSQRGQCSVLLLHGVLLLTMGSLTGTCVCVIVRTSMIYWPVQCHMSLKL